MPPKLLKFGLNSEFRPIQAVLLHKPGHEIADVSNPVEIQHIKKINSEIIKKEYLNIIKVYKNLNIRVFLIDPQKFGKGDNQYLYNMMYTRDLIFMTPKGAIICQMAGCVRKDEVRYAQRTLKKIGVPVLAAVKSPATCEGADILWLSEESVIIGVGNRTNIHGLNKLRKILKSQNVKTISVSIPHNIQHLLGILQLIDKDLALIRGDVADAEIKTILSNEKINTIYIPESEEVMYRQAMNIVTIAPREILMPTHCPQTKKIYQDNGIKVIAEIPISQLINGGGGLACATSILSRC